MSSTAWDQRYAGSELLWGAEPNRFLPPQVEGLVPGRALDLACGEGRNAVWLASTGWTVTAVDFSTVAIDKGRAIADRAGVEVDFQVADVTTMEVAAGAYDLVIMFYLQLLPVQRSAVTERATRALAPGGTFLLVAHDLANLERGHGGPQDPAVLPTAELVVADLLATAAGAEMEVELAGEVERPVDTAEGTVVAIDCMVRARRRRGRASGNGVPGE